MDVEEYLFLTVPLHNIEDKDNSLYSSESIVIELFLRFKAVPCRMFMTFCELKTALPPVNPTVSSL